jgi:hypothetical protein
MSINRRPSTVRRMEPLEQHGPTLSKERSQVIVLLFSHDYCVYDTVLKMRIFFFSQLALFSSVGLHYVS